MTVVSLKARHPKLSNITAQYVTKSLQLLSDAAGDDRANIDQQDVRPEIQDKE